MNEIIVNARQANEAAASGTGATRLFNSLQPRPATKAMGVVDFNAAGEAAMSVTIDGVVYLEADAAVVTTGVWTNGASAADSATSLAAAINGDTRSNPRPFQAHVSAGGDSVVVYRRESGTIGNVAMTTTSASNCTVDAALAGGAQAGARRMMREQHVVTAQDVLADEVNFPCDFVPTAFSYAVRTTAGVEKVTTGTVTIQTGPDRVRYQFAGATDPIAGDVICVEAWE